MTTNSQGQAPQQQQCQQEQQSLRQQYQQEQQDLQQQVERGKTSQAEATAQLNKLKTQWGL